MNDRGTKRLDPANRKLFRFQVRKKSDSGIILLAVLWVLVILSLLVTSLSRYTNIELSLAKYTVNKTKANFMAWAGIHYAIEQIWLDSQSKESSPVDNMYRCAIRSEQDLSTEELFFTRII